MAAAIANRCIDMRLRVIFMVVPDLLDYLRTTFGPNSGVTYDELFEQVRNASLLILDDLGSQTSSPWANEKLFQIFNHRYNALLPTVVTTSGPLDQLDESLLSRLTNPEVATVIEVERQPFSGLDSLDRSLPSHMTFSEFYPEGKNLTGNVKRNLEEAYKAALEYAESLNGWLVLMGPPGRGKTHLAAAIAHYQRQGGKDSLFVVVPELLDKLRSTYEDNSKVTYDELFSRVKTAELLVLDDYGEEYDSPWAREKLYQILNYRYNALLPTVITTTLSLEKMDERIRSRIVDLGKRYVITAPNYPSVMASVRGWTNRLLRRD